MDRFTNRFLSQVQVLQDRLETLLEKDWGPKRTLDPARVFETQTDLKQLETLGWSLPDQEPERSQVLFERLAPYFETGFCFHLESFNHPTEWQRWRLRSAFHHGSDLPLLPEDLQKRLDLPPMNLTEVRKLKPLFLLEELRLPEDLMSFDTQAFVLRPSDARLWVLFSSLPDLFLKSHLTAIQDACLRLLADFLE